MAKNLLQDMVKVKRKTWKTQTSQEANKNVNEAELRGEAMSGIKNSARFTAYNIADGQNKERPRYKLWFVAVISLVFFLFSISYLFSGATITVNPKIEDLVLNENLSANLNSSADVLPFDLVVISGEESKMVQTSGEKDFSQNAEGLVVIYNTFSASTQTLSIDTRLEGSNGKIYKTQARTVVPGMNKDGKPGSVEVKIYGSDPGSEYNSIPLDFKIVNFKGTPKYSKFYGRSKGEIAGGLKGKYSIISDDEKTKVMSELKTKLQTQLLRKATDQIPKGFILFKDAVYLFTDENNIDFTSSKDTILPTTLKGTLYGIIFDESKLTKKIAEDNINEYDGGDVFIPNIRDLIFTLSQPDNVPFRDLKNIDFNLSGSVKIVWKLDADKLASDLLGKSKKDFKQILLQYPSINSADLVLSPIWKLSIPDDTKNIKMIVNYPK